MKVTVLKQFKLIKHENYYDYIKAIIAERMEKDEKKKDQENENTDIFE